MRSPFPGMDPYLEAPAGWAGVHSRLINAISEDLADRLMPAFLVTIEERVYLIDPDEDARRPLVPDLLVVRGADAEHVAASVITPPTLIEPLVDPEVHDRSVEIRDRLNREVVATIEILSPRNKAPGTPGREAFLRNRSAVLQSGSHWIEIDLLRAGERPPDVRGRSDYYALLKRGGFSHPFEVWYFDLRDHLPTIAVPLRPPWPDVPLDLQAALTTVYRRGHYADLLAYGGPVPPPPLDPADASWVAAQISGGRDP
jgi:hypothetical protein